MKMQIATLICYIVGSLSFLVGSVMSLIQLLRTVL